MGEREQNTEIVLFAEMCHFIPPDLLLYKDAPVADSLSATRWTDCSNPVPLNDDAQPRKRLANPSRDFKFQDLRLSVLHTEKTMHERTGGTPIIVLAVCKGVLRTAFQKGVRYIRNLHTPLGPWFHNGSAHRRSWSWQDCQRWTTERLHSR